MALLKPSIRLAQLLNRQCARSFSRTSRVYEEDSPKNNRANEEVLNILGGWTKKPRQPKPSAPRDRPRSFLASNMAEKLTPKDVNDAAMSAKRADYEQQLARNFKIGDVYSPHDLSGQEMAKWKRARNSPKTDAIDALGINPVNEYKNVSMMSEYMTEMGRIKQSKDTGLRPVNQRKMAKAIRRAIGIGLMPSVHRHPELLMRDKR